VVLVGATGMLTEPLPEPVAMVPSLRVSIQKPEFTVTVAAILVVVPLAQYETLPLVMAADTLLMLIFVPLSEPITLGVLDTTRMR
jgi:hypothetical protein